jgi:hypothetical protein
MPVRPRGARSAALLAALVVTAGATGCGLGGSVADADRRSTDRTESRAPAQSPFCAASRANTQAVAPLNRLVATGAPDREELADAVEEVRRTGADLLLAAPPEIREDVQQTVDAVDLQLDALLANGGDGRAVAQDPALSSRLNSPELTAAGQRVTDYVTRTCGTGQP